MTLNSELRVILKIIINHSLSLKMNVYVSGNMQKIEYSLVFGA